MSYIITGLIYVLILSCVVRHVLNTYQKYLTIKVNRREIKRL